MERKSISMCQNPFCAARWSVLNIALLYCWLTIEASKGFIASRSDYLWSYWIECHWYSSIVLRFSSIHLYPNNYYQNERISMKYIHTFENAAQICLSFLLLPLFFFSFLVFFSFFLSFFFNFFYLSPRIKHPPIGLFHITFIDLTLTLTLVFPHWLN